MDMATQPASTVILYGRSPLLNTVELTLRQNGRFPITRLSNTRAPPQLANIPPGTIIYDRDQMDETAVYQLLTDYPNWRLLGLTASEENFMAQT